MLARVVTFEGGDPTRVEEVIAAVRDRLSGDEPTGLEHSRGFWMFVDRKRAHIFGISIFEDGEALRRGSEQLDRLGHPAPDAGGRPVSVEVYEIPVSYEREPVAPAAA
jgi:hypothetical protein